MLKAGKSKGDGSCNIITYDIVIKVKLEIQRCFEARHPRCVGSIAKNFCVLHIQSNATIFHLLIHYVYNYMFRPSLITALGHGTQY